MLAFSKVSPPLQGSIGVWVLILLAGAVYLTIRDLQNKRYQMFLFKSLIVVFLYSTYQCISCIRNEGAHLSFAKILSGALGRMPIGMMAGILILLTILEGYLFIIEQNWRRHHISADSIKEAMDHLPVGICCFRKNGRVILKNEMIDKLCHELTGEVLLDGNAFWRILQNIQQNFGDKQIVQLSDGRVFSVQKEQLQGFQAKYDPVMVLTMSELTEEYQKTVLLKKQQEALQEVNKKLLTCHKEMVSVITARELLNAKIKIHDEMGYQLLAARACILNQGTEQERRQLKEGLKNNIQFLRREKEASDFDELETMLSTAQVFGVNITVDGKLPGQEAAKQIILTAIHECFTNTLRHAKGDQLFVRIWQEEIEDGVIRAEFTNNGDPPKKDMKEKGGLLSLRDLIQQVGGRMEILTDPAFILRIEVPKEEKEYGLSCTDCG